MSGPAKPRLRWSRGRWREVRDLGGFTWVFRENIFLCCRHCGEGFIGNRQRTLCFACRTRYGSFQQEALRLVSRAVRTGQLPPVSPQSCVDCGAVAHVYDHRDYSKPLLVQPVCRSCNRKRGMSDLSILRAA